PSPTPFVGWLHVPPSSVRLGCDADYRTQVVTVENTGPEDIHWQADVIGSGDQAGVALTPEEGELEAGASVSIELRTTFSSSGSQSDSTKRGSIPFAPDSTDAGPTASLSFTTQRCH